MEGTISRSCPNVGQLAKLAERAGTIMIEEFSLPLYLKRRSVKPDGTALTPADIRANQMLTGEIHKEFPHIRVIAEEGSEDVPNAEHVIFCDPIDGTIPFCRGIQTATCVITHMKEGLPHAAVIHDPFQKQTWVAQKRGGAWRNEDRVRVSSHNRVRNSHICMIWWHGSPHNLSGAADELMRSGGMWINPLSIALFGGLVASGQFDATILSSKGNSALETAAMHLIVEEAGGLATDLNGKPLVYDAERGTMAGGGHIISNGTALHDELVEIVSRGLARGQAHEERVVHGPVPT